MRHLLQHELGARLLKERNQEVNRFFVALFGNAFDLQEF